MKNSFNRLNLSKAVPSVRQVTPAHIISWLSAGWRDVRANPVPSIAYGLLFGIGGDLILLASIGRPHLFAVAVSGFFLIAPLLAAGLYELSRRQGSTPRATFIDSLMVFRRNSKSIALFGLLLGVLTLIWERTSAMAFAGLGEASGSNIFQLASRTLADGNDGGVVMTWLALGAMLALLSFVISVVSLPLIIDRQVGVSRAVLTSLSAFAGNVVTLLLWAACIVALTLLGFATLLFGLVIIMPILGHASWHAYRDLVE